MPIYEYVCPSCKSKFELLRSISQANEDTSCPQCQGIATRILSMFACLSRTEGGQLSSVGNGSCSSCSSSSCGTCGL